MATEEPAPRQPRLGEQADMLLSTPQARRIVAVTLLGLLVLGGLFWWVVFVPFDSGGPTPITCGAILDVVDGPEGEKMLQNYENGCDRARTQRRNNALVIAGVVMVVVLVVGTWPSERLVRGPDGARPAGDDDDASQGPASELHRLGLVDEQGNEVSGPLADEHREGGASDDGPASELVRLGLLDPAAISSELSGSDGDIEPTGLGAGGFDVDAHHDNGQPDSGDGSDPAD